MEIPEDTAAQDRRGREGRAHFEGVGRALKSALTGEPVLEAASVPVAVPEPWTPDIWKELEKEEPKVDWKAGSSIEEQILGFYREYRPGLYRYLRSLTIASDLADEIVQEVFLRLTDQLLAKQDIQTIEGWAIRVAHNLAVNACREMSREVHVVPEIQRTREQADPAHNPEQAYLEKERMLRMKAALERLNAGQRHCFLMRAQGFRYKDIGAALGISSQRACALVKKAALRLAALCE